MDRHPQDFLNPLTSAQAHAELFREHHPEYADAMLKFLLELARITNDLKNALGYKKFCAVCRIPMESKLDMNGKRQGNLLWLEGWSCPTCGGEQVSCQK
ncbi:protein of unknown function [Nitrospira japonica]|uniref:Uncharacterized protein n=1 Tax=Nitrospira japonica TaxID=1325564 RepID=A0A1W1I521_9BACT|nr:hypothetical protein [Nitrospira japonica]SLM48092.1 protein of unknown function [Nitrospira japonica]